MWFDAIVTTPYDNLFQVVLDDKWNFMNQSGKLTFHDFEMGDDWLDDCMSFVNGFSQVKYGAMWKFANSKGESICDEWFESVSDFSKDGVAIVWNFDNECNIMDGNGYILSDEWFGDIIWFNGYGEVERKNGKKNYIDKNGKLIGDEWFDSLFEFKCDVAMVKRDQKYNFINREGKLISEEWFDAAENFYEGWGIVMNRMRKFNFIDKNGNYLSREWFEYAAKFVDGFSCVMNNSNEWNYIDKHGNYLSKRWFKKTYNFQNGYGIVYNENGKINYIDKKGKILSDIWFDDAYPFSGDYAWIKTNGRQGFIYKNGLIFERMWEADKTGKIKEINITEKMEGK